MIGYRHYGPKVVLVCLHTTHWHYHQYTDLSECMLFRYNLSSLCTLKNPLCNIWSSIFSYYDDIIMSTIASQITSLTVVYSTIYSGADQSKHQSSASLAFVWGIHRGPVNSPHKWPLTRKMFPFDDVIMACPIVFWWLCERLYFTLLSKSNQKYESVAIV